MTDQQPLNAVGARTSDVGPDTLYALGALYLGVGLIAGMALLIALLVPDVRTGLPIIAIVAVVAAALAAFLNGLIAWALMHWFGNSLTLLESVHSNLFQVAQATLEQDRKPTHSDASVD